MQRITANIVRRAWHRASWTRSFTGSAIVMLASPSALLLFSRIIFSPGWNQLNGFLAPTFLAPLLAPPYRAGRSGRMRWRTLRNSRNRCVLRSDTRKAALFRSTTPNWARCVLSSRLSLHIPRRCYVPSLAAPLPPSFPFCIPSTLQLHEQKAIVISTRQSTTPSPAPLTRSVFRLGMAAYQERLP
eukprot:3557648-Rhodomonas_salina.2